LYDQGFDPGQGAGFAFTSTYVSLIHHTAAAVIGFENKSFNIKYDGVQSVVIITIN
jgi:hypothetical protein